MVFSRHFSCRKHNASDQNPQHSTIFHTSVHAFVGNVMETNAQCTWLATYYQVASPHIQASELDVRADANESK